MNSIHNYRRISRDTNRLAIQIQGSYDLKPLKIWRIRTDAGVHDFRLEGFFLDDAKARSRTAVTHVSVGEVVMITFAAADGMQPAPVGFRINTKGDPVALKDLSAFNVNQIVSHGPLIDFDGHGFLHVALEDPLPPHSHRTDPDDGADGSTFTAVRRRFYLVTSLTHNIRTPSSNGIF